MAGPQATFLQAFCEAFDKAFGPAEWETSRQRTVGEFCARCRNKKYRRSSMLRANEAFELGDLRARWRDSVVVVEYDREGVDTHNLVKYWPYLRGDLAVVPPTRLLLCYFSDWRSWGSSRDLWAWVYQRIRDDSACKGRLMAEHFDHGKDSEEMRTTGIGEALGFLRGHLW